MINICGFAGTAGTAINGLVTGQAVKCMTSGSGLTTTAPASISSPTTVQVTVPHVAAHD